MGIVENVLGCGKRCRYERRCKKVCWGVGEVSGDVGKSEGGNVGKCVRAPHLNTLPCTSLIPFLTRQHTSPLTPYTLPHPYPHFSSPHTSFLSSLHTPTHFPTPLPTAPLTSPYTPTNTFPHSPHALSHTFPTSSHSFDYVAKLPCDDVTLINLTGKAQ